MLSQLHTRLLLVYNILQVGGIPIAVRNVLGNVQLVVSILHCLLACFESLGNLLRIFSEGVGHEQMGRQRVQTGVGLKRLLAR